MAVSWRGAAERMVNSGGEDGQTYWQVVGGGGPCVGKRPGGLCDKGGKGEPVVVPVLFQIRKRDKQEAV